MHGKQILLLVFAQVKAVAVDTDIVGATNHNYRYFFEPLLVRFLPASNNH